MKLHIRFLPEAEEQTKKAIAWWRQNRPAAPDLLEDELEQTLHALVTMPELGRKYPRPGVVGARRQLLPRTRYHVYYRVQTLNEELQVLAVWSALRKHGPRLVRR